MSASNDDIKNFLKSTAASAAGAAKASSPATAASPIGGTAGAHGAISATKSATKQEQYTTPSPSAPLPPTSYQYSEDDYNPAQLDSPTPQLIQSSQASGSQASIPKGPSTMVDHSGAEKSVRMERYITAHMDKKTTADEFAKIKLEISKYLKNPAAYPNIPMDTVNWLIHQAAKDSNVRTLPSPPSAATATATGVTPNVEEDALLAVAVASGGGNWVDIEATIRRQQALLTNGSGSSHSKGGNSNSDKKELFDSASAATRVAVTAAAAAASSYSDKKYNTEREKMTEENLRVFAQATGLSIEELRLQQRLQQPTQQYAPASGGTASAASSRHGEFTEALDDSLDDYVDVGLYTPSDSSKPDTSSTFNPKELPEKVIGLLRYLDTNQKLRNIGEKSTSNASNSLFLRIEHLIFGDLIMQRVMKGLSEPAKAGSVYKPLTTKVVVLPTDTLKSLSDPKHAALHFAWCVDDAIKAIEKTGNLADRFIANLNLNPVTAKMALVEKNELKLKLSGTNVKVIEEYLRGLEFSEYFPDATQKDFRDARENCRRALIQEKNRKPLLEVIIDTLISAGNDSAKTAFNSAICSVLSLPNRDRYCIQFSSNEDINRAMTVGLTLLLAADTLGPYHLISHGGVYEDYTFLDTTKKARLPKNSVSLSGTVSGATGVSSVPPTMLHSYKAGRVEDTRQIHIEKSVRTAFGCKTDLECYEVFVKSMEQNPETRNLLDSDDGVPRVLLQSALGTGDIRKHIADTFTGPAAGTGVTRIDPANPTTSFTATAVVGGAVATPAAAASRNTSDVRGMNYPPKATFATHTAAAATGSQMQKKVLVSNADPKKAAEHFAWCKEDTLRAGDTATATGGTLVTRLLDNMKKNPETQLMCEQLQLKLIALGSNLSKVKDYIQALDWDSLIAQPYQRAKK